jgi:hypothetical protein
VLHRKLLYPILYIRHIGVTKVQVHIDSCVVVQTLNSTNGGSVIGWCLVQEIRRLLALEWKIKVCHSYQKANVCADAFANMRCDYGPGFRRYAQCHIKFPPY